MYTRSYLSEDARRLSGMRKKTEYSEHPAPCVVLSRGASATVILRDNIARLEDAEDGAERWEADEYRISTANSETSPAGW
jgi:hypothetical protein